MLSNKKLTMQNYFRRFTTAVATSMKRFPTTSAFATNSKTTLSAAHTTWTSLQLPYTWTTTLRLLLDCSVLLIFKCVKLFVNLRSCDQRGGLRSESPETPTSPSTSIPAGTSLSTSLAINPFYSIILHYVHFYDPWT